jgi:hypothetical protein
MRWIREDGAAHIAVKGGSKREVAGKSYLSLSSGLWAQLSSETTDKE